MKNNNFYKVTAEADVTKPARLDLMGEIGGGFWSAGFDEADFSYALREVGETQPLDIYINSQGGSVFAAMAIYNLIARHKGKVTIHVAGLAASAATIITSVPNGHVIMPTGSMMLVHPARVDLGSATPEELKEAAENLEKVRQSILDVYEKKTGLDRGVLFDLMNKESFLTAEETIELGFANELDPAHPVENVIQNDVVMINGLKVSASLLDSAPKGYIKAKETTNTEVVKMDINALKAEYPELVEAIKAEAMKAGAANERARILAIEEIATAGHEDLVQNAKQDGNITAEMLAVQILKADKARAATMLNAREQDAQELANIAPVSNEGINPKAEAKAQEDAELKAFIEAGRRGFNQRKGSDK